MELPAAGDADPPPSSSLIFLGTGCSTVVPDTRCLIRPSSTPPCPVCSQALSLPPDKNPNYRCNTSPFIDYCDDDGTHKYIIIDVGKTFREQVLRWFVHHKIPWVNSVRSPILHCPLFETIFLSTFCLSKRKCLLARALERIWITLAYLEKANRKKCQSLQAVTLSGSSTRWNTIRPN